MSGDEAVCEAVCQILCCCCLLTCADSDCFNTIGAIEDPLRSEQYNNQRRNTNNTETREGAGDLDNQERRNTRQNVSRRETISDSHRNLDPSISSTTRHRRRSSRRSRPHNRSKFF